MLVASDGQLIYNVVGDFMKRPELLAPAGNYESFIAAVQGGCDAVYLAGKLYGARSFAGNFSNDEIVSAIKYAHLYGVKVYVTVNTLIYEDEIPNFLKYVHFLHESNVDALIIQDIGMFDLLHQTYPNLELHTSTQMHIHNIEGCKLAQSLGAKRVVIARETPLSLIKEIKNQVDVELEVFIHGALCISYSGQCLMSSMIGGRSGNRGTCAQCCRQPYDLIVDHHKVNEDKYLLSTKDLNTLDNIGSLIDAGVDSLKIEGRMKRPEYIFWVVSLYRKAIDSYLATGKVEITKQDINNLKKLFNRSFTKGFLFNEENNNFTNEYRPNHMGVNIGKVINDDGKMINIKLTDELNIHDGIRIINHDEDIGQEVTIMYCGKEKVKSAKPGSVISLPLTGHVTKGDIVVKTTDGKLIDDIQKLITQSPRHVPLTFFVEAKINQPLKLKVTDEVHLVSVSSDYLVQASKNNPVGTDIIKKQIAKLGNTIYTMQDCQLDVDENIFIPLQKINELRRTAIEKLNTLREYRIDVVTNKYERKVSDYPQEHYKTIYVENDEQYNKIKNLDYREIYADKEVYESHHDERLILKIPRVLEKVPNLNDRTLVGELGSLSKGVDMVTDFSFNVVNSYTVALLHSFGARKVTLSYELNKHQIDHLIKAYHERYHAHPNLELVISGKIEVMISKYNLLEKYHLAKEAILQDKFHNNFKVTIKDNLMYIYHFAKQNIDNPESYYELGVNSLRDGF